MQKFVHLYPFFRQTSEVGRTPAGALHRRGDDRHVSFYIHRFPTKLLESGIDFNFLAGRTLPMPRRDAQSAALYLSWLEMITREAKAPFLLVRGNQVS